MALASRSYPPGDLTVLRVLRSLEFAFPMSCRHGTSSLGGTLGGGGAAERLQQYDHGTDFEGIRQAHGQAVARSDRRTSSGGAQNLARVVDRDLSGKLAFPLYSYSRSRSARTDASECNRCSRAFRCRPFYGPGRRSVVDVFRSLEWEYIKGRYSTR